MTRVGWVETRRNDIVMRDIDEYLVVNVGGMKVITPEFAGLLGGGVLRRSMHRDCFHDEEDQILRTTDSGGYYVPFDDLSSWGGQVVVGLLLPLGQNLVARFGYEAGPGSMQGACRWAGAGSSPGEEGCVRTVAGGSKSWSRSGLAPIFIEGWSASPLGGEGSVYPLAEEVAP